MKINTALLVRLRNERSWSQDELALSSGLNLRTVQRIEKDGIASLQSKKALAAALAIDARDLDDAAAAMACPVCRSTEIYRYKQSFSLASEDLLPSLGGMLLGARIQPSICAACGYILLFTSEEARKKARSSKHWIAAGG